MRAQKMAMRRAPIYFAAWLTNEFLPREVSRGREIRRAENSRAAYAR
jgi:hypothetical protein